MGKCFPTHTEKLTQIWRKGFLNLKLYLHVFHSWSQTFRTPQDKLHIFVNEFMILIASISLYPILSQQVPLAVNHYLLSCWVLCIAALDVTNRHFPVRVIFASCYHPKVTPSLQVPVQIYFPDWNLPRTQLSIGDTYFLEIAPLLPVLLIYMCTCYF